MHPKNMHAIINYRNISLQIIQSISDIDNYNLSLFDYVYSPSDPIDITKYTGTKFLFGPHFSTFPDSKILNIQSPNSLYIVPSQWCIDYWKNTTLCKNLNMICIPFGVDTEKFCEIIPIHNRGLVFIYYKSRHPEELMVITELLKCYNVSYRIFNYHQRYDEKEYLQYLQQSKWGIWIDGHESQGFALEEALSCNIPLLVWNVKSMNQEYGRNNPDIPATTIPYWDERCGEYFYHINDLKDKFNTFLNKLESYKPREYVLENLSISVCEEKFVNTITNYYK